MLAISQDWGKGKTGVGIFAIWSDATVKLRHVRPHKVNPPQTLHFDPRKKNCITKGPTTLAALPSPPQIRSHLLHDGFRWGLAYGAGQGEKSLWPGFLEIWKI